MTRQRVLVVGAGIGGLTSALELAAQGADVTVLERAASPGGKLREVVLGGRALDAGPTVFTMRWVFDALFDAVGARLDDHLVLQPLSLLARHAWAPDESTSNRLDLFADVARSADAIGTFAGPAAARGYLDFCRRAGRIYRTLERPFMAASRPGPLSLAARVGLRGLPDLLRIAPMTTLWQALGRHFADPRLRQLFGRYATYCGSSPFSAPGTLMLVAHVEQAGVWQVQGGMHRIAEALAGLVQAHGGVLRYGCEVERVLVRDGRACGVRLVQRDSGGGAQGHASSGIDGDGDGAENSGLNGDASGGMSGGMSGHKNGRRNGGIDSRAHRDGAEELQADAVVFNGDAAALASGLLGNAASRAVARRSPAARSLSAVTWNIVAPTSGFPLAHHTAFFSADYAAEFADIGDGRLPGAPTVYVCAQDRGDVGADAAAASAAAAVPAGAASARHGGMRAGAPSAGAAERLLLIVNAPARGDARPFTPEELARCDTQTFSLLQRCGLHVQRQPALTRMTAPQDFERLFPGTGGALYGQASHGWMASFSRPGARSRLPGLYLAGGSVHPGPGVPMAALSGRQAAASVLADLVQKPLQRASAAPRPSTPPSPPAATPGGTSTR